MSDWFRATLCPYCNLDSGGNHQWGCPSYRVSQVYILSKVMIPYDVLLHGTVGDRPSVDFDGQGAKWITNTKPTM